MKRNETVGFIGLGKLGLPVATCVAMKGHKVVGYDRDESRMTHDQQPYQEAGPDGRGDFNDFLGSDVVRKNLSFGSMEDVARDSSIIFVAVQTPHDPKYEGVTRIPAERKDFQYHFLTTAVHELNQAITGLADSRERTVVIISTCLPGTVETFVAPLLPNTHLVYNPFFIAMGTTMRDFLNPEFVLMGGDDRAAKQRLKEFYATLHDSPVASMSIPSAELAKVCYNTFISFKIAFANTVMEICDKVPKADCDEVIDALSLAYERLISPAYLRGGMGDGGGCHPRDNIAMSWLARKHKLSYDLFDAEMICRERQAEYLKRELVFHANSRGLPIVILGYAFKPKTNLTIGSPAILIKNMLVEEGYAPTMIDANVELKDAYWERIRAVYLIGCRHPEYERWQFPSGSVVIDPHRYIAKQDPSVLVRSIGSAEEGLC